ncbi:hypothetical protein JCGZ_01114 [Jatropha curcas]|uniref:Xyloglucan endotransglucosylase/hydrolase n=2 Tax=Jatropha curcas TaxID=180498 RepID=A0A067KT94_JATCU|nr:hypothetical protein JCGZ_01114 [Jatropha curcas]
MQSVNCSNEDLGGPSIFDNYEFAWGSDHVRTFGGGTDVQIFLDQSSGARFESKAAYGGGYFSIEIKVPGRNSAGVVTTFYLTSVSENGHDELDFEFLGNKEGQPVYLQTNVFAEGKGEREQRFKLWFDPTADFHRYTIFWNQHMIVFYVDDSPIRVFKNNRNIGVGYLSKPMKIAASIWNGDGWATDGGRTKINWAYAPFIAGYRDFTVSACPVGDSDNIDACISPNPWWNQEGFWTLGPSEDHIYQYVKSTYKIYDYCTDQTKNPTPPPECGQ